MYMTLSPAKLVPPFLEHNGSILISYPLPVATALPCFCCYSRNRRSFARMVSHSRRAACTEGIVLTSATGTSHQLS